MNARECERQEPEARTARQREGNRRKIKNHKGKKADRKAREIYRNHAESSERQVGQKSTTEKFANLKVGGILTEVAPARLPKKVAVGHQKFSFYQRKF
ncbi:MAG: hypothetical protein C0473_04015 [Cyanobacteria bacterium DS3.002]|nr:hypothetical protein [Cyanobacteria bacterium DS3.002]MBA4050059.1 hypothetical protein [Cyanobacteria bacterium DS2.008]